MGKHQVGSCGWVGPFLGSLLVGLITLFVGCGKSGPASPGDPSPVPSPTHSSTLTLSPTVTRTPTLISTPTAIMTPTPARTPTPCAGSSGSFGNQVEQGVDFFTDQVTVAYKVTVPVEGQLTYLQLFKVRRADPGVPSSFKVGLYSDNGLGTAPATLLVESSSTNAPAPPALDLRIPVSNFPLEAGKDYWLAFSTPGGLGVGVERNGVALCLQVLGVEMPLVWGAAVPSPLVPHLLGHFCQ